MFLRTRRIHFVGIGGIGMSGIAEVMHNLGYSVQGSDVAEGYVVEGLRAKGIKVMIGHRAENLGDAAVVVLLVGSERSPEVLVEVGAALADGEYEPIEGRSNEFGAFALDLHFSVSFEVCAQCAGPDFLERE